MAILLLPSAGQAGWIEATLEPSCSDDSRTRVAAGTRRQIEFSVRRAEASIQPPDPVGQLSCLEGLMETRIDQFAPTGNLDGLFSNSLDGLVDIPGQLAQRVCSLAEKSWNKLTRPLEQFGFESDESIPPGYFSRFGLVNIPGHTSSRTSSRPSGQNNPKSGGLFRTSSQDQRGLGEAPASTGRESTNSGNLRYDSQTGEYIAPDGKRIFGTDAESTLINEIWKSLYGG